MKVRPLFFVICLTSLLFLSSWAAITQAAQVSSQKGGTSKDVTLFEEAMQHYSKGDYTTAITDYRSILGTQGLSPQVLHNLANCYAALDQNGKAILTYLRALRLAPSDEDIQGDLNSLRKDMGLFDAEQTFFEKVFSHFDMNQWLLLALCFYILLTLVALAHLLLKKSKWLRPCLALCLAISCICLFGAWEQRILWQSGVIISPQTKILMSPFASAASLGTLQEGTIVKEDKMHNGYLYLEDTKGRAGWVAQENYEQINTSSSSYSTP